jgi:hypothetical protein
VYLVQVRALLLCALLLGACGTPVANSDGGDDAQRSMCEEPPPVRDPILDPGPGLAGIDRTADPGCTGQWVVGVEGRVEDPAGVGIPGARTQICVLPVGGSLLCLLPPTTDASGAFEAVVTDPAARCAERITMRVLLPASINATSYCELELTPTDAVVSLTDPLVVFGLERPACLPPEGDPTEPRTVTLADGLELVGLRPEQIHDYDQLAAARHDLGGQCMLRRAPAGDFLGAYGLRPETDVDGGVGVRIPNATGLAAGASVDLYLLGGLASSLADGTAVEEGEWARFGTGTVSGDGRTIESDPGTRLTVLNWIAYRAPI